MEHTLYLSRYTPSSNVLEQFQLSVVCKTKTMIESLWPVKHGTNNPVSQSKLKANVCSWLVLVSLLIGRPSCTSFLSQSLSVVMQNHSKYELLLTLNARENSALLCHWGTRKIECLTSQQITCMAAMFVYWHVTGNDEIFVVISEGVLLKKQLIMLSITRFQASGTDEKWRNKCWQHRCFVRRVWLV